MEIKAIKGYQHKAAEHQPQFLTLPIRIAVDDHGYPVTQYAMGFTDEDRALVAAGGVLIVTLCMHPPIIPSMVHLETAADGLQADA